MFRMFRNNLKIHYLNIVVGNSDEHAQQSCSETSLESTLKKTGKTLHPNYRVSSGTVFFAEYCTVPFFGNGEITVPQSASIVQFFFYFL